MWRSPSIVFVVTLFTLAGCGDDSGDDSDATSRTVTSVITHTPGAGGFIETPQSGDPRREGVDELGVAVPEVTRGAKGKRVNKIPKTKARVFTGVHADSYERAKAVCGASSMKKLASDLDTESTNPFAIADAFTRKYPSSLHDAVFEGCVVGLTEP